jgi:hypothetical protein
MDSIKNAKLKIETYWNSLIDTGLIDCETLCECLNALEKQISRKIALDTVIDEIFGSHITFESACPICNNIYIRENQNYCDRCGQKLE